MSTAKHIALGAGIALISVAVVAYIIYLPSWTKHEIRTVTVSGHAEKKLVPDEAHLQVNLNSMKPKIAEAKASHDEKLRALLALAKDAGVEDKKVRTESSTVQPIYEYVNPPITASMPNPQPKREFKGYRVQTLLDMTVVDTSKVGVLMEKITQAGFEKDANTEWGNLLDLNYQVSEPEKKRDELLAEAIAAARTKAERMASAAGSSVVGVQSINEGQVSPYQPMPRMMMAKAAMMAEASADMAPVTPPSGEENLQASVSVVFELK